MTRRITVAFLAVLFAVIVVVVVPLGAIDTHRLRSDFRRDASTSANALAAVSEERLDDRRADPRLPALLARSAQRGDGVVVLDRAGHEVASLGPSVRPADDRLVVRAPVGDAANPVGAVVLSRAEGSVEDRVHTLWLLLGGAALLALVVGALVGRLLGRWIATPLRSLVVAAEGVGAGSLSARAEADAGPPQVREVAAAFNTMADQVTSLLDAQTMMTADVSHQLRTPLAALRLRLDLLGDEVDEALRPEVSGMIAEISRLSRLVDGLLAVAGAEAAVASPRTVDVAAVCAERVGSWEPLAAERGIRLDLRNGAHSPTWITPGHLEQILDNVLANALDALAAGGTIRLDVTASDTTTTVRIADDGPGMDPELREHAFDRFVTDRRGEGGTGLGLAIVGRLVAADRGNAGLLETAGGGLTVEITLPAAEHR
jgi:signal transduction histidine kinase